MKLDPITTEVINSRIRETTAAMAHALFHSGYSPILRESQDGTAGLCDAKGRVIMVGGGLQYHSLLYTRAVESVMERYPVADMRDGDSFISNDPFKAGNSHVPDIVVITPVFYRRELIAFGASVAHKADVGGLVPGSSGAAAREIFHDGILVPPVRYWTRDGVNREVEAILRNNSRVPEVVIGDLRGQVGSTRLGAERLCALCDEYGNDTLRAAMASLIERTTARVRGEFARWPDGEHSAQALLDHDGADRSKPVRIKVTARKQGDRLTLDFSETDAQARGPVNTPLPTAQAVSLLAVIAACDPTIPMNSGVLDAVDFVMPAGTLVHPQFPASVNHYFPTSHVVYTCVLAALGKLNPGRAVAPAGFGTGAIAIGYTKGRTGKPTVQYELMVTSLGGTSTHDGTSIVLAMNHFTPGTPVEIIETEYPVMVRRYDIWRDSAGAGRYRGGVGNVREYQLLVDCILTARTSNHRQGAWGLDGGQPPAMSRAVINPGTPQAEEMDCMETRTLPAGTVVRLEQAGGAGYGDPSQRAKELVRKDVEDGYVSAQAAAAQYKYNPDA
ncbi:MAG TPA: hydantoinase B/oxoprolinase family protein [Xanthobacteraceae bacterium]|jgi:N-methylhydantoinase B